MPLLVSLYSKLLLPMALSLLVCTFAMVMPPQAMWAQDQAPEGYVSLFNGQDLTGWYGLAQMDPRQLAAMTGVERAKMRDANQHDVLQHWRVENGELVNDGEGVYLATERDYRDYDMWIDYKTVAGADSGIYLRGNPQVQIWDYTEAGGKWNIGADKGSGGLWNNSPGAAGKDPQVLADKPFGEWNRFRIQQVGGRTSVWLNGQQVVSHAIMENFFDRSTPHVPFGPIQLQTHGGEIRWRNIFLKEISPQAALSILAAEGEQGFTTIFNGKDFSGWKGPTENYQIQDGVLMCKDGKGGTIYTAEEYSDFVVRVEFKLPPGGNNGLAIRYPGEGDAAYAGMCELQVLDTEHKMYSEIDPRQAHGSAYGMIAAHRGYLRPAGEWNFEEVTVQGSRIRVELNGTVILDGDLANVTEFMANSPHPGKDLKSGHFGFAGHSDPVEFRNVRIKRLDGKSVQTQLLEPAQLGATRNVHRCGGFFFAGQPGKDDVDAIKQADVNMIVDLRMPDEIDWDEQAVMTSAGLAYQRVPFAKPEELTDDVFDAVRKLLAGAQQNGKNVLIHCGGANRVGAVWLPYRVLDQGIPLEDAVKEATEIGLSTPSFLAKAKTYIAAQSDK